jgi:hypothetical protein
MESLSYRLGRLGLILACCIASITGATFAVNKVIDNGPDDNRLVWVFVGDGYTADQQTKYLDDVDRVLATMFAKPPWSGYRNLVNVYAVQVISNESGADEAPNNLYADTYFDARFWTANIERLLTINNSRAFSVAQAHVPNYDSVLCIVNSTRYGGAGGSVSVCSANSQAFSIMDHEYGHTFAGLADEYETAYPGYPGGDPEPNVQIDVTNRAIKWAHWIEPGTPIPTPETASYSDVVGAFEGARYLETGIYRPKQNCAMRSLGAPYCEVCREVHIVRLYEVLRTWDSVTPTPGPLSVSGGNPVTLSISTVTPSSSNIEVTWRAHGLVIGTGQELTLSNIGPLPNGTHTVRADIIDNTAWVRADPGFALPDQLSWTVTISGVSDQRAIRIEPVPGHSWTITPGPANAQTHNGDSVFAPLDPASDQSLVPVPDSNN